MKTWLGRINGAIGIALTWAFGWALVGMMVEVACSLIPDLRQNAFIAAFDAPLRMVTLVLPGFLCGAFFSMVVAVAERRRGVSELSPARFAVWGGVAGLMLLLIPALQIAEDLASHRRPDDLSTLMAAIVGVFAPLSAISATGYLALARSAEPWRSLLGQLLATRWTERT